MAHPRAGPISGKAAPDGRPSDSKSPGAMAGSLVSRRRARLRARRKRSGIGGRCLASGTRCGVTGHCLLAQESPMTPCLSLSCWTVEVAGWPVNGSGAALSEADSVPKTRTRRRNGQRSIAISAPDAKNCQGSAVPTDLAPESPRGVATSTPGLGTTDTTPGPKTTTVPTNSQDDTVNARYEIGIGQSKGRHRPWQCHGRATPVPGRPMQRHKRRTRCSGSGARGREFPCGVDHSCHVPEMADTLLWRENSQRRKQPTRSHGSPTHRIEPEAKRHPRS